MSRVKVLRIINRLNLGGPTYNVGYLTKYMAPEYDTLLVSGQKDESEESSEFILNNLGIEPLYVPEMKREIDPFHDIKALKKLNQIISDYKPDIVHTHAAKAGTVGRLAAYLKGVPVIVHTFHGHVFHSYFSPLKTNLFLTIERFLAARSTAIVAISELQKQELVQQYRIAPESKFRVVPLGFDLTRFNENQEEKRTQFRNHYFIEEHEIAVSIVGRLVPVKNHDLFLRAAKIISDEFPQVRFFVVGDGELHEEVTQLAQNLKLEYTWFNQTPVKKTLTFTSWRRDIDVVNAGSDIICLTSLNEGTPVSLIEAQASGKPLVSSRVGGVENIVPPSNGLLFNSGNLEELVACLRQLIKDEKLRRKMSEQGWEFVKNNYHYTRLVSDMKKLYQELLLPQRK